MPELPEVESVRRELEEELVGRRILRATVRDSRLRFPVRTRALRHWCDGARVESVERRAKYLIVSLEGDGRLLIHLGMTGTLTIVDGTEPPWKHGHVIWLLEDGRELRFRDPRRFGLVDALAARALASDPRLADLGPEPLTGAFDGEMVYRESRGTRRPIKNLLMDAAFVVGVGNIYASEALFLAGIHPHRAAGRIGRERCERLSEAVKRVLTDSIQAGGTTIRDFAGPAGKPGRYRGALRVYGRAGEPCVGCDTPLKRSVLVGRSTYYCGHCQR